MGFVGFVNLVKVVEVDDEFGEDVELGVIKRIFIEYLFGWKSILLWIISSLFGKKKSRRSIRSKLIINSISFWFVFFIVD